MPHLFRTVFENPRYRPLIKIIVVFERLSLAYPNRVDPYARHARNFLRALLRSGWIRIIRTIS
jgi:hypothetical protein